MLLYLLVVAASDLLQPTVALGGSMSIWECTSGSAQRASGRAAWVLVLVGGGNDVCWQCVFVSCHFASLLGLVGNQYNRCLKRRLHWCLISALNNGLQFLH
jgi:hypothetical protein